VVRRIGGILGRSPFGPVHEHMLKVKDCASRLRPILAAFVRDDRAEVSRLAGEIFRLEAEADAIKTDIRSALSSSLFSAVQHGEVIALLTFQDDVADDCQNAARLMDMRRTRITPKIAGTLEGLGEAVGHTVERLAETTTQVQDLDQSPDPRESLRRIHERAEAVRAAREEVSERAHRALQEIFAEEEELGPVSVIVLMQLVRELSRTAHGAENAADAILRLIRRQ